MLYHYNRPVNSQTPRHAYSPARHYEWQCWPDEIDALEEKIQARYAFTSEDTRTDKYFMVPGRVDQIPQLHNDETFEIRTLVGRDGPLELWESSIEATFPLKRTQSARIASKIPRFSGSFSSVATPESLTESLKRKSKYFELSKTCRHYAKGEVKAQINHVETEEGQTSVCVALMCEDSETLLAEVAALGLRQHKNVNFGQFLLTA